MAKKLNHNVSFVTGEVFYKGQELPKEFADKAKKAGLVVRYQKEEKPVKSEKE